MLAKKKRFYQKIWFSNFANYSQMASQEVWIPFILTFYSISVPNYLQKTYFILPAKNYFFWQKIWFSNFAYYFQEASREVWKSFILTFYPISVLNYQQKHPYFVLLAKNYYFWQKSWFSNFANHFQVASQEVWKSFILTLYPVSVPNYLQKTSKFRFASKKKRF